MRAGRWNVRSEAVAGTRRQDAQAPQRARRHGFERRTQMTDRNEALRRWEAWVEAENAVDNAGKNNLDHAVITQLNDAAADACHAYTGSPQLRRGYLNKLGNPEFCAITGVPLLESDDVVMVLKSALPGKQLDMLEEVA